jgi:hypothetical protein
LWRFDFNLETQSTSRIALAAHCHPARAISSGLLYQNNTHAFIETAACSTPTFQIEKGRV